MFAFIVKERRLVFDGLCMLLCWFGAIWAQFTWEGVLLLVVSSGAGGFFVAELLCRFEHARQATAPAVGQILSPAEAIVNRSSAGSAAELDLDRDAGMAGIDWGDAP